MESRRHRKPRDGDERDLLHGPVGKRVARVLGIRSRLGKALRASCSSQSRRQGSWPDLALPVDPMTTIADIHRPAPGMPHVAPRAMPTQDLRSTPTARPRPATPLRVRLARLIAFGGAAAIAGYGAYEMVSVVSAGGITQIEWLFTLLFVVNFTWIAFAASTALAGLLTPPARRRDALVSA